MILTNFMPEFVCPDCGIRIFHENEATLKIQETSHSKFCRNKEGEIQGQMMMSSISKEMIAFHQSMIDSTYKGLIWSSSEVDQLICHQVGHRPHRKMASVANVPVNRAPITYRQFGNITSATIPVNLYFNRPNKGDKVLILGAGSGLSVSQTGMVF